MKWWRPLGENMHLDCKFLSSPDPRDQMIKSASCLGSRLLHSSLGPFILDFRYLSQLFASVKVISDATVKIVTLRLVDKARRDRGVVEFLDRPSLLAYFRPNPGLIDRIYRALVPSGL